MSRAEITHVKEGRVFVGVIQPLEDRDIVIELHRDEQKNRPADVRFMILSRDEFRQLLTDWTEFNKGLRL
jgi:ferredoxin-fold anticodon binding domain-containing protein